MLMNERSDPPSRSLRLGAFDADGKRVATMQLDLAAGRLSGSGEVDLRELVDDALKNFDPAASADVEADAVALLDCTVRRLGLTVRRIAESDIVFSAFLDRASRMTVGRSAVAQGVEPFSAGIEARIAESLAGIGKRFADNLAERIENLGAADAAAAVGAAHAAGELNFEPTPRLGDALAAIDVATLDDAAARAFLPLRVMVATGLDRDDLAATDAALLLERWSEHRPELAVEYRNVIAIAHARAGRLESAMTIWLTLAYDTLGINAGQRAQMLRNLSFSVAESDPRALSWIEQSVDAFLQAGERREAAINYVHWGNMLQHHDAGRAVSMLESADTLLDEPGPIGDALRAAVHHVRARRLAALGRRPEALAAALDAIALRRGLAGQEAERLSSLRLAEKIATELADPRATELAREFAALLTEVPHPRFVLGAKIDALSSRWDPLVAAEIRAALDSSSDLPTRISAEVTLAMHDPGLTAETRLAALEALHERTIKSGPEGELLTPIRLAISHLLQEIGAFDRSIVWLERILADAPLAADVADALLATLRHLQDWPKAVIAASRELALKGESFSRLLALSDVALAADLAEDGLRAALRARELAGDERDRSVVEPLIARGLGQGATLAAARSQPVLAPVTVGEFEQALRDFADNIASVGRMDFWEKPSQIEDYQWVARPERFAQIQLRRWLDARFGGRVTTLEELGTGAGRLDLLVQLAGGAQVILELKMLGFRYSTTYAAEGVDQILHYMANRKVALGYLVVFDARLRGNGNPLVDLLASPTMTVREVFVDVTPRIEKRSKSALNPGSRATQASTCSGRI